MGCVRHSTCPCPESEDKRSIVRDADKVILNITNHKRPKQSASSVPARKVCRSALSVQAHHFWPTSPDLPTDLQPTAEQNATSSSYVGCTFCKEFNLEGPLVSYTAQIQHPMVALLMAV